MRIPSIILLSSAALALLVQAEKASHNGPVAAVPVLSGPVAAIPGHDGKAQAPLQVSTDAKEEKKPAEAPPSKEDVAKDAKAVNETNDTRDTKDTNDTEDTNDTKDTKDPKNKESDPRPVGNGIVVTTTSFSKSKNGSFLGNLLGIDLDLNIGGHGDETKKDRDDAVPDDDSGDEMEIPDDVSLYGDDGYVPRPLPAQPKGKPPCKPLVFLDQLVWDMQGSHGKIVTPPKSSAHTTTNPRDATAPATHPGAEISADHNTTTEATMHSDGIRICILDWCIGGPPDDDDNDDDDDDETKPGKKHINHKQRKFLRGIAKRTPLSIDSKTGCPIPSTTADPSGKP